CAQGRWRPRRAARCVRRNHAPDRPRHEREIQGNQPGRTGGERGGVLIVGVLGETPPSLPLKEGREAMEPLVVWMGESCTPQGTEYPAASITAPAASDFRKSTNAIAAGLLSPCVSSTAPWAMGACRSAGTTHTSALPSTWLAATNPSSALPLSTNCSVWEMFSPQTIFGSMAS